MSVWINSVTPYQVNGEAKIDVSFSNNDGVSLFDFRIIAQGGGYSTATYDTMITFPVGTTYTETVTFNISSLTTFPFSCMVWVRKSGTNTWASAGVMANSQSYSSSLLDTWLPIYYPAVQHQWVWDSINGRWDGQVGSCVANTITAMKEVMEYKETGRMNQFFSASFVYGNRLAHHYQGEGMYPFEAMDMLVSEGVPLMRFIPDNNLFNDPYPPTPDRYLWVDNRYYNDKGVIKGAKNATTTAKTKNGVVRQAKKYKVNSYSRYKYKHSLIDTIKTGIMMNGAVFIDCYLTVDSLYIVDSSGITSNSTVNASVSAGHALLILGWKQINGKLHWICQNSWDTTFGDGGRCYIPYDWLLWDEVYIVTDENNYMNWKYWEWSFAMAKGVRFDKLTATEYNQFTAKINDVRNSFGMSLASFTPAVSGQPFYFYMFNEIRNAINPIIETGVPQATNSKTVADQYGYVYKVMADHMNTFRDKLNQI